MGNTTEPDDCSSGSPSILPTPAPLLASLDDEQKKRLNATLLEYARDSSQRQATAYASLLEILTKCSTDGSGDTDQKE